MIHIRNEAQYRLKSRKSRDTCFTQSETYSNLGTISDVFDSSEQQSQDISLESQVIIENEGDVDDQPVLSPLPSARSSETIINT